MSLGEEKPFRIKRLFRSHNQRQQIQQPPLVQAAEAGNLPLVRLLLARGDRVDMSDRFGRTALMEACARGHSAVARLLLARGASVLAQTKPSSFTPLLMAIHSIEPQSKDEARLVSRGDIRLIRLLIFKGADIDARDDFGNSILSYAVSQGRVEVVRLLLAQGAKTDTQSRNGYTPLIMAAAAGYPLLVRILLEAGANPALCTRMGHSALWFARKHKRPKTVAVLVAAGAPE